MFKKASIDGLSFIYGSRNTRQQGLTAYQGFNEEKEKKNLSLPNICLTG